MLAFFRSESSFVAFYGHEVVFVVVFVVVVVVLANRHAYFDR